MGKLGNLSDSLLPLPKKPVHVIHRISLHGGQHMAVDPQSHADIRVPKNFLNHFRVDAHTQEDSGCAMPQIMKAHRGQTCLQKEFFEYLMDPRSPKIPSTSIGKDKPLFFPPG